MRLVDSEAAITPEGLAPLGYPEERIDDTDQDQQYCHVTDQEARDEYCRSTPDGLTKPMTEDKFRTCQGQIYGTSRRRTEKIWRLVTLWSERDLAHLPTMQRVAQEQEMENVYETFDEEGLDTALAIMEHNHQRRWNPAEKSPRRTRRSGRRSSCKRAGD
jgi:hypothetical protein